MEQLRRAPSDGGQPQQPPGSWSDVLAFILAIYQLLWPVFAALILLMLLAYGCARAHAP
ncbi:MAG TPA: hypothetical protein VIL95_05870 [Bacillota bacterium]